MKYAPFGPVPWDLVVFITITMTGLGISVNRLSKVDRLSNVVSAADTQYSEGANAAINVIDLGCIDRRPSSSRFESDQKSIRLRGRFCNVTREELKTFDGVWVKNLSSGEDGTAFLQGQSGTFVTDLVPLAAGKNIVQVEWKGPRGVPPRMVIAEILEK